MNNKIINPEKPHLILCEGIDAFNFLIWFLDDIKKRDKKFEAFHVYNFGGITELSAALETMSLDENFKTCLQSVSIIRDAETNAEGAIQSIKSALQSAGLIVPSCPCSPERDPGESTKYPTITVGYLLFPTCSSNCENGTLEDLCLSILAKDDANTILEDVNRAIQPYIQNGKLPRQHKNKLHAYFSFTDDFVSLKIGEAARAGAFSWTSPQIELLKKFLNAMLINPNP